MVIDEKNTSKSVTESFAQTGMEDETDIKSEESRDYSM